MARKRNQDSNDFPSFKRPQLNLKHETRKGVLIVLFLVLAIVFVLSLVGLAGPFGSITNRVLKLAFGLVAYLVPLIFMFVAFALFRQKSEDDASSVSTHAYVGAVLITLTLTGFLHLLMLRSNINRAFDLVKEGAGGGYLGVLTSYPLMHFMGFIASLVILLAGFVISILVTFNVSFADLFQRKNLPAAGLPSNGKLKINNAVNAGFTKETIGEANKVIAKGRPEVMVNGLDDLRPGKKMKMSPPVSDKNWKFPSLD